MCFAYADWEVRNWEFSTYFSKNGFSCKCLKDMCSHFLLQTSKWSNCWHIFLPLLPNMPLSIITTFLTLISCFPAPQWAESSRMAKVNVFLMSELLEVSWYAELSISAVISLLLWDDKTFLFWVIFSPRWV